jgi:hypothetical protein
MLQSKITILKNLIFPFYQYFLLLYFMSSSNIIIKNKLYFFLVNYIIFISITIRLDNNCWAFCLGLFTNNDSICDKILVKMDTYNCKMF